MTPENNQDILEKRKLRCKQTAEVFTPPHLVNQMLDKLHSNWSAEENYLDPACGDGNFLVEVLKRKLQNGKDELLAIGQVWGVELMEDNVELCKMRLLDMISEKNKNIAKTILDKNIVCSSIFDWDIKKWKSRIRKTTSLF